MVNSEELRIKNPKHSLLIIYFPLSPHHLITSSPHPLNTLTPATRNLIPDTYLYPIFLNRTEVIIIID